MFLLAGELMLRGGLVDRLIRLARALVGICAARWHRST